MLTSGVQIHNLKPAPIIVSGKTSTDTRLLLRDVVKEFLQFEYVELRSVGHVTTIKFLKRFGEQLSSKFFEVVTTEEFTDQNRALFLTQLADDKQIAVGRMVIRGHLPVEFY